MTLLADIVEIFDLHQLPAEVIAASIRNLFMLLIPQMGAHRHGSTRVIMQMIQHPLTEAVKKFLRIKPSKQIVHT